jgi:leader peptidase (prepilin peptidase)/N-methyltransferase
MPHIIYIVFFFALGASIGSFLNVVVWRLPRGESLVSPPSRCPVCLHPLAWYDNIPVFGWLALRGRCRYCLTPISAEYPTVEFITGALFVLYYVLYFMVGGMGPCWTFPRFDRLMEMEYADHRFVTSIREHWPQYVLAVFTVSALLAASLIDARNFFIPLSIPVLMAVIGVLYHTILDRPGVPGSLNVESGGAAALAVGAGLGVLVSLALVWTGRMRRSFADGWPQLEVEKDPSLLEPAEGRIARAVRRIIERFRRPLTPDQARHLAQQQAEAKARDEETERLRKEEEAKHPQPVVKEFTRADITREIRKEMVFLMPPILLGIAAFALVRFVPGVGAHWNALVRGNTFVSGFCGALLGGLVGGMIVWLFRILGSLAFGREAMGMGDVDLMFGVGTIVGAGAVTVAFFVAPLFAVVLAIYMYVVGKRRELPFGPYLSLGTAFVMIYYCPIAAYFRPGLAALGDLLMARFGGGGGGH